MTTIILWQCVECIFTFLHSNLKGHTTGKSLTWLWSPKVGIETFLFESTESFIYKLHFVNMCPVAFLQHSMASIQCLQMLHNVNTNFYYTLLKRDRKNKTFIHSEYQRHRHRIFFPPPIMQNSAGETFFLWLMFTSLFNAGSKQSNGLTRQRAEGQWTSSLQPKFGMSV